MTLLSDFKLEIGDSTSTNDQYYVDNFLRPALDKLSQLSCNIKKTTVTLISGTQSYNLVSLGSPAVGSSGIYDLVFDGQYYFPYVYKRDVVLQTPTLLYFIDSGIPIAGALTFKYKAYYSSPTLSPYAETDAPVSKLVYVKQWAVAHYKENQVALGTGGFTSKSEDGLSVSYSGSSSGKDSIYNQAKMGAEEGMSSGASGDLKFWSIQVV